MAMKTHVAIAMKTSALDSSIIVQIHCRVSRYFVAHENLQHMKESTGAVASFPGSPRTRTKNRKERGYRFSVLQATESWAGPGNEATGAV